MAFGGYTGIYKDNLLDSSYEYIYCKILEKQNIKFKTHEINYDLGYAQYTPDFFLYDKHGNLTEIVEIRGHRLNIKQRQNDVNNLRQIVKCKVNLITEIDLRKICKDIGLSYNQLKVFWRTSENTILNYQKKEFNAMYGKHHTEESKELISKVKKEFYKTEKGEETKKIISKKLTLYLATHNHDYLTAPRSKRVVFICPQCGKKSLITEAQKNSRTYCSYKCYVDSGANAISQRNAIEANHLITLKRHQKIKEYALNFAKINKNNILLIKLNKIKTDETLKLMIEEINTIYNIKDIRTISTAICGVPSRKEMVKFLKNYLRVYAV